MENLIILGTAKTPSVKFDVNGELEMRGRCFPEAPLEFFKPFYDWMRDLRSVRPENIRFNVKLDYINTSSSRCIFDLLSLLEEHKRVSDCVVNWYCNRDDEDMIDRGEELMEILDLKFNIIELQ